VSPEIFDKLSAALRGRVLVREPLSRHTTWRVGGPADLFLVPVDRSDLLAALGLCHEAGLPWMVLGAGSNLLVRDGGIRGAVIHTGGLKELVFEEEGLARAGGGLPLMTLIRETVRRGLAGLEGLAGIPGTVGGGVTMNAGAGGQDLAGVVRAVTLASPEGEEIWEAPRLHFGYRGSSLPRDRVVVEVLLAFERKDPAALEQTIREHLARRRSSQGVRGPSAGSVFKNPTGTPAWRLIDEAGLRGASVGGAQVSTVHTNFIVNTGGATARDVMELIEYVRKTVCSRSGVTLEPEVRIAGEDG